METDEQIFEAAGALEPDHPSIKHYVLSDLAGLYTLTLSILGLVISFTFYSSDTVERNPIYVVVFYTYLYFGSFLALFYMHVSVRSHRRKHENKLVDKLERKQRELKIDTTLSHNELIIESCKELDDDLDDFDGSFSYGEEGVQFLTRVGAIGFAMASFIMDGLDLISYVWKDSISFDCYGAGFIVVTVSRILFVYSIASFIFKYHKIVIHTHMALWKFLLGHLLATSLTLWGVAVIIEALESFAHNQHSAHHDESRHDNYDNSTNHDGYGNSHDSNHSILTSSIEPGSMHVISDVINATTTAIVHSAAHFAAALQDNGHANEDVVKHEIYEKKYLTSAECLTQDTIGVQASPYLFPFVIEFALIAAAAMHHLYRHIQRREDTKPPSKPDILIDVSRGSECHKSTIGLFLGILVFAVTIIFVALYLVMIETNSLEEYATSLARQYFSIYSALNIIGILAVIVCFYKMRTHGFSDHLESPLDQNLLLLSLAGFFFLVSFQAVAGGVAVDEDEKYSFFGSIHLTVSFLSFVQMTMQTVFIILGFRMRSRSLTHVIRKPGRAALTFLLVLNMAMWVANTFMQKMLTQSQVMSNFYGSLAWIILFNILLPLTIFYRFHSAICLAEIWIEAYKLEDEGEEEEHEGAIVIHHHKNTNQNHRAHSSCTRL